MKNAKNSQFGEFLKTTAFSQTVLPDRSLLIGQELLKNAIFEKKVRHFGDFQTMWL